ncbi:phage tail protein [Streptomyces sp. BYX5S]
MTEPPAYRWLNREGCWRGMNRAGLELAPDGSLRLQPLPAVDSPIPADPGQGGGIAPGATRELLPAGLAALPTGDVFLTCPDTDQLLLVRACAPQAPPVPCPVGPARLCGPRGLAWHADRRALLIADSGHGRIVLLDPDRLQLLDIWEDFTAPSGVATGPAGQVYVVDGGLVLARDRWGSPLAGFRCALPAPAVDIATTGSGDAHRLCVRDAEGHLHLRAADGTPLDDWATGLEQPLGLAAADATVYIGDNADRHIHVFGTDGLRIGTAHGYEHAVTALAVDHRDGLLAHTGAATHPVHLARYGARRTHGTLVGGPYRNPRSRGTPLHLVRAHIANSGTGAGFRLHVCSAGGGRAPDDSAGAFTDPGWRTVARDAPYTLLAGAPEDDVWVGVSFEGDGHDTPVLAQIRIDFDHDTYLRHLPELYQQPTGHGDFLARWLTIFETAFDDLHSGIEELPTLFDPMAAPPAHLPRLADWLAVPLPPGAPDPLRRRLLRDAARADARRGTAAGLRDAIHVRTGVDATVDEPVVHTDWWALPGSAPTPPSGTPTGLGLDTVLAAADPQGAVIGSSAVLDGSVLAAHDAYASHLFAEVAHRFTVRYRTDRADDAHGERTAAAVRAVVDAEKPAHTTYHLCAIEPRMRLGVQDRLGVDTVVAGPPRATRLTAPGTARLRLDGPVPDRIGTTRLGHHREGDTP